MKFAPVLFVKNFFDAEVFRKISTLILQEAILLALVSLVILLSLESLLPGTVSLRKGILFFILGISGALLAERSLSKTLSPEQAHKSYAQTSRKTRILFGCFTLWSAFLLGNALFGFHIGIIILTLLLALPILWLFYSLGE